MRLTEVTKQYAEGFSITFIYDDAGRLFRRILNTTEPIQLDSEMELNQLIAVLEGDK